MKVSIYTNSQAPIGRAIEPYLDSADDVFIASAYLSAKAINTLTARIEKQEGKRPCVDILFGLDDATDMNAVQTAHKAADKLPDNLRVRYTPHRPGHLFHPKAYFFRCGDTCHIFITSANLTAAGQSTNEEMYCHVEAPKSHEVVAQFQAIREHWWDNRVSAEVDDKVVDAREAIEYYKGLLAESINHFAAVMSNLGKGIMPPPPPPDVLAPLREALAEGYLITSTLSLSNLYVSVQDILKPGDSASPVKANEVVIVKNRLSASVSLLPEEVIKELGALQRAARVLCETWSLPLPDREYVPVSAHATLSRGIKELERDHAKLIRFYINNKATITNHLIDKLEAECQQVWDDLNPQAKGQFSSSLLPKIKSRVEERRLKLKANPAQELPFSFQAYPHRLVLMHQMPRQKAWQLQKGNPDRELIRTFITLLRGQVNLILGVTQLVKPSAIKSEYERVRLLVAIRGKAVDALLSSLSSWVRETQIKTRGQTLVQKQQPLAKKVQQVKSKAKEHLDWLKDLEMLAQDAAVKELLDKYHL